MKIQTNWQVKRLDEVATVTMGQSPASSSYNSQGAGVHFLQGTPPVVDSMGAVVPNQWTTEPTRIVEAGTALMTVRAPVGKLFTTNNSVCLGRGLAGIKANNDVSQAYLNYYLQFSKNQLDIFSQGSTFTAINSRDLKGIRIILPSYKEQEYIGNVLNTIDYDISKTNQIIQKTKVLKQGIMQIFFTGHKWISKKIDNVGEVLTGGTPKTTVKEYWGGSIRWMSSSEVNLRRIKDTEKRITNEGLDNSNARLLPIGTVMVALAGQGKTRGKVAILEIETTCNQSLAGIVVDKKILLSEYLFYNFEYRYQELRDISGGEGRSGLNLTLIKEFQIPIPIMVEQKKIVEILTKIDDKISINRELNQKYKSLKKGLMQDIFRQKVQIN